MEAMAVAKAARLFGSSVEWLLQGEGDDGFPLAERLGHGWRHPESDVVPLKGTQTAWPPETWS